MSSGPGGGGGLDFAKEDIPNTGMQKRFAQEGTKLRLLKGRCWCTGQWLWEREMFPIPASMTQSAQNASAALLLSGA